VLSSRAAKPAPVASSLAYRLCAVPQLPERHRSAPVFQLLARMENGPVSLDWLLESSRLSPAEVSNLIQELTAQGCLQTLRNDRPASEDSGTAPLLQYSTQPAAGKIGRAIDQLRRAVGRERAWAKTHYQATELGVDVATVPMALDDVRRS
jgi:hypothetical protein